MSNYKKCNFWYPFSEYQNFNKNICHLFLAEEFSEPESYSSPVKVKKSIPAQQQNEIEPADLDDGYGSPAAPVISAARSVNFNMSFWCLQIPQNINDFFFQDFCPSL
jgi:hypothetical protein